MEEMLLVSMEANSLLILAEARPWESWGLSVVAAIMKSFSKRGLLVKYSSVSLALYSSSVAVILGNSFISTACWASCLRRETLNFSLSKS